MNITAGFCRRNCFDATIENKKTMSPVSDRFPLHFGIKLCTSYYEQSCMIKIAISKRFELNFGLRCTISQVSWRASDVNVAKDRSLECWRNAFRMLQLMSLESLATRCNDELFCYQGACPFVLFWYFDKRKISFSCKNNSII